MRTADAGGPVVTSHPDHVRSLFTAKPEQAPSLTGESPLRPIVGTELGPDRGRRAPHAPAQAAAAALPRRGDRALHADDRRRRPSARSTAGRSTAPFALAPRMQAITLDVIMAGIFGIEGRPERGTPEHRLRQPIKRLVDASTWPVGQLGELMNIGREEPVGADQARRRPCSTGRPTR